MRIAYPFFLLLLAHVPASAFAQDAPVTATILQSQRTGVGEGLGAAFDRTLRSRLDALAVVDSAGAVSLDLEQIQLALGCMGETTECLSAVAAETGVTIVVVPSLAQAGATTQATVLVFDTRDSSTRRATREATGADAEAQLLGGTEGLLRELFGLPANEVVVEDPPGPTPTVPVAGLSPVPFVLIGVGAAALVGGIVAGVLAMSDGDAYANAPGGSTQNIDALLSILSRAQAEALAANVLLIGGAVLVAAGVVWTLAAGREDGTSPLSLAPSVGPGSVGLALSGSFGGVL